MADEKALTIRKGDLRPRNASGMLQEREDRMRNMISQQLLRDADVQALAKFAFLEPEELETVGFHGRKLTQREKRIARAWEQSKKDVPAALLVSHERVINAMRSNSESKSLSINVERAVIRVPDTRHDDADDAVVIDVEVNGATG